MIKSFARALLERGRGWKAHGFGVGWDCLHPQATADAVRVQQGQRAGLEALS